MSLNEKKTIIVFEKTCTIPSLTSFSNPIISPHQPSSDAMPKNIQSINNTNKILLQAR